MIPIPPHLPDAGQARRSDSPTRSVPPVIDTSVNIDHGVTLNISPPVGESATEGRARDALNASVSDINRTRIGTTGGEASSEVVAEMAKMPPGLAQRVGKLLAQLAMPELFDTSQTNWPAATGGSLLNFGAMGNEPGQGLMNLRQQLADSPMFDLHRLVDRLMPAASQEQTPAAAIAPASQLASEAGDDTSPAERAAALASSAEPEAPQAPRLDQSQVREGLRLLMHGRILWEGELSPGLFARVEREDGWEADPNEPGQMIKGAALNVELRLPRIGTIMVRGLQFKDAIEVAIEVDDSRREFFAPEMNDLLEGLKQAGLSQVRPRMVAP